MKNVFMLILCIFILTGCEKTEKTSTERAEITSKCQLSGTGEIECTFKNSGKAKGSLCHRIELINTGPIKIIQFKGDGISDSEICSGIVEAGDVRQTKSYMAFGLLKKAPHEMCSLGYTPWTDGCGFVSVP